MTSPLLAPMPERIACASCGADISTAQVVAARDYHCNACHAELAHLDLAPNGIVRSVLGWLRVPGDVLHERYRIRGFLGKGGFAATYLVEDQRLNGKRRAAKEIPEIFFDERETEILSRIQHPCVPDITDRFTADGMIYLVLEFGGDRTLESVRLAEGGRIALAKLRPWIEQLCDALAYLHAQNPPIVHRDLKPANILLDEADRVMLIDFGIAKEATPDMMTRTIARSASHGFSPPEQVLGTGTDERADVYALGATMYALLTGRIPPPAHERVSGTDVVPIREIAPEIPRPVADAILRALELNVAKRQATIEEFRRGLTAGHAGGEQVVRTTASPRTVAISQIEAASPPAALGAAVPASRPQAGIRPAWLMAGAAMIALLVGALVLAMYTRSGSETPQKAEPIAGPPPPGPSGVAASGDLPSPPTITPKPGPAPYAAANDAQTATVVTPPPPASGTPAPPQTSAYDALMQQRVTQSEPEPPIKTPGATQSDPPAVVVRTPAPKPKPKAKAPAGAQSSKHGWDDFEGPKRGTIRKID